MTALVVLMVVKPFLLSFEISWASNIYRLNTRTWIAKGNRMLLEIWQRLRQLFHPSMGSLLLRNIVCNLSWVPYRPLHGQTLFFRLERSTSRHRHIRVNIIRQTWDLCDSSAMLIVSFRYIFLSSIHPVLQLKRSACAHLCIPLFQLRNRPLDLRGYRLFITHYKF